MGAGAARRAWARLAGLPRLDGLQVVVDAESPIGRRGWIGILALEGTVTACVPSGDLKRPVTAALGGLTTEEATSPDVVRARLPATRGVLGPAALFYPPVGFGVGEVPGVEEASSDDLQALFRVVASDELDESGLREVTGPEFACRSAGGDLAAVCGYRRWPQRGRPPLGARAPEPSTRGPRRSRRARRHPSGDRRRSPPAVASATTGVPGTCPAPRARRARRAAEPRTGLTGRTAPGGPQPSRLSRRAARRASRSPRERPRPSRWRETRRGRRSCRPATCWSAGCDRRLRPRRPGAPGRLRRAYPRR
jgi:hypothetical protein